MNPRRGNYEPMGAQGRKDAADGCRGGLFRLRLGVRETFFVFFHFPPCAPSGNLIHYVLVRHPMGLGPGGRDSIFENRRC